MPHSVTALLIAVAFAGLASCGQTGPLYMPPEPVPETAPEAPPAAPAVSSEQPITES